LTALEQLNDTALVEVSRRTDAVGVVSVYVDADPRRRDAAAIDIKNRYRELQRRVAEDAPADRGRQVLAALEEFAPEVERLTNPTEPGRGRILFAALTGDWDIRLESQMPVPNRVVLNDRPAIHPLLELLDEGRPAGVVLVTADEARLLEWRVGMLQVMNRLEREAVEAPHERAGQIGGGPPGQFHTPMLEHRQARERDWAQRFLNRMAEVAAGMAADRGWERILVSGGEQWTEPITAKLPDPLQENAIRDTRVLAGLDHGRLLDTVTERLHEDHAFRQHRLVEQVRDAGLSQAGALGLSEVATALNAGRVAHLVYDPEIRYRGSVGADGALYADDEIGPGGEPAIPEPRLTERLVERALATGARVNPVEGAARGMLSDAAGIGALLRW
jgi:Bacterial archaeo-eukaryotic release factor family 10